jgi:hypothetical protein
MAKDGEHFFMLLLAIFISSFENYLFNLFAHLLIELFVFQCLIFGMIYVFWILILSNE